MSVLGIDTRAVSAASGIVAAGARMAGEAGGNVNQSVQRLNLYSLDPSMSPTGARSQAQRIAANVFAKVREIEALCIEMNAVAIAAESANVCELIDAGSLQPMLLTQPPDPLAIDMSWAAADYGSLLAMTLTPPRESSITSIERVKIAADGGTSTIKLGLEVEIRGELRTRGDGERTFEVTTLGGGAAGIGGGVGFRAHLGSDEVGASVKKELKAKGLVGVGTTYNIPAEMSNEEFYVWIASVGAGTAAAGPIGGSIAGELSSIAGKLTGVAQNQPEIAAVAIVKEDEASYELNTILGFLGPSLKMPTAADSLPLPDTNGYYGGKEGVSASATIGHELVGYRNGEVGVKLTREAAAEFHGMTQKTAPGSNNWHAADTYEDSGLIAGDVNAEVIVKPLGGARVEIEAGYWSEDGTQYVLLTNTLDLDKDALTALAPTSMEDLRSLATESFTETVFEVDQNSAGVAVGAVVASGEVKIESESFKAIDG